MGIIIDKYDEKSFREKRQEFQDYLGIRNWDPPLTLCEMKLVDGKIYSTKNEIYSGYFNPYWNTRNILPTEWVCEFDGPDFFTNLDAIYSTCINLIKQNYHFVVLYAQGMRSPHIRIYDLLPSGLSLSEIRNARKIFTLKMVSMEYHGLIDTHLLGSHKVCLEFAKHWKYDTAFDILFEHIPGENGAS